MVIRETLQHRTVMAESSGQFQSSPYDPSEMFVEVVHPDRGKLNTLCKLPLVKVYGVP